MSNPQITPMPISTLTDNAEKTRGSSRYLPEVTAEDEGKIMSVSDDGDWGASDFAILSGPVSENSVLGYGGSHQWTSVEFNSLLSNSLSDAAETTDGITYVFTATAPTEGATVTSVESSLHFAESMQNMKSKLFAIMIRQGSFLIMQPNLMVSVDGNFTLGLFTIYNGALWTATLSATGWAQQLTGTLHMTPLGS